jgi:hypothetical protein
MGYPSKNQYFFSVTNQKPFKETAVRITNGKQWGLPYVLHLTGPSAIVTSKISITYLILIDFRRLLLSPNK